MTVKGPLGILPRPFTSEELLIRARKGELDVNFGFAGPFGGPRPLAKPNPVTDEDVQDCVESGAADNFVSGLEDAVDADISSEREQELKQQWCKGLLTIGE